VKLYKCEKFYKCVKFYKVVKFLRNRLVVSFREAFWYMEAVCWLVSYLVT